MNVGLFFCSVPVLCKEIVISYDQIHLSWVSMQYHAT